MFKFSNLLVIIAVALSIYWGYGYEVAQKQGETSLEHYIQSNIEFNKQRLQAKYHESFRQLDSNIKADDRLKKGGLTELSEAIGIYQAENDSLPSKQQLDTVYRDARGLLKDSTFKYATSTDGKHFEISVKLKDGQEFKLNR